MLKSTSERQYLYSNEDDDTKRRRHRTIKESKDKESDELSQEQLQQLMIIVPEEGMNVKALQTKYRIIDWEVYTEDSRMYWKIIKVDSSEMVNELFKENLHTRNNQDSKGVWKHPSQHRRFNSKLDEFLKGKSTSLGRYVGNKEDLNLKFLRSLPSEWNTHVVVRRNKPDLDTMSFNDLYNNFKIIKQEVKGAASSSSQNVAFVSSSSSTNEVNTAYGVSTANTQVSPASTQVSTVSTQVSTANLSDVTVYAFLANQPNGSQLVHNDLGQIHEHDLEEMYLKWQLALLSMRTRNVFQKTGRKITINGSDTAGYDKSRNQDISRRTINVKEISSKAMLAINGAGFDWRFMADEEVPINMALMAFLDFEKFQQPELKSYGPNISNNVNKDISNEVMKFPDALLVEELVSNDKLENKTVFPTVAKINFVKHQQQEKPVRKPVKYAEMY
ncbi:hypothetical protein Tco_0674343 [Tanacetum coccineum]